MSDYNVPDRQDDYPGHDFEPEPKEEQISGLIFDLRKENESLRAAAEQARKALTHVGFLIGEPSDFTQAEHEAIVKEIDAALAALDAAEVKK